MLKRAKEAARRVGMLGVTSFRLGEIEHLPIADGVADAVLSNCVLNLCAPMWKPRSAWPAQRRPSGRLAERQAEARGSPRHDLALKEASGEPAGRGLSQRVSPTGAPTRCRCCGRPIVCCAPVGGSPSRTWYDPQPNPNPNPNPNPGPNPKPRPDPNPNPNPKP